MTLQIQVGDIEGARRFYGVLFGRPPEYESHDDFLVRKLKTEDHERTC